MKKTAPKKTFQIPELSDNQKEILSQLKPVDQLSEESKQITSQPVTDEQRTDNRKSKFSRRISVKAFILSQLAILLIGLIFVGGLYFLLNQDNFKQDWANNGPVTTNPISFNLELNSPDDDLLSFDKTVVVSGKTAPLASVIISSNDRDLGLQADNQGGFSKVIDLSPGVNQLKVTSYDSLGNSKTIEKQVYYSEEKI